MLLFCCKQNCIQSLCQAIICTENSVTCLQYTFSVSQSFSSANRNCVKESPTEKKLKKYFNFFNSTLPVSSKSYRNTFNQSINLKFSAYLCLNAACIQNSKILQAQLNGIYVPYFESTLYEKP